MQGEKVYKNFLITAKYWLKELDYYGEGQFKQKTPESSWTIGQIYEHLINGTYDYHLNEIKKCLEKKDGSAEGEKKFKGSLIFFLGKIPPVKIKGIGPEPLQPESPIKVKDSFFRFFKVMQKTAKEIDAADLKYKTMHPTLGMLNALEWFKLIEMHFKHHLRQKDRLDKHIRSVYKITNAEADIEV